jgi:hypothetical protein
MHLNYFHCFFFFAARMILNLLSLTEYLKIVQICYLSPEKYVILTRKKKEKYVILKFNCHLEKKIICSSSVLTMANLNFFFIVFLARIILMDLN